jgi:hypothetical protein
VENQQTGSPAPWPELDWNAWRDTADTLHMLTQIVGKTRLSLTPLQNHWWNVPLYVSARGLTTSAIPWRADLLEVEFDFAHELVELRLASGEMAQVALRTRPVAEFYAEYMAALRKLGVEVRIWPVPVEVASPIRFDHDLTHASWDRDRVLNFHQVLVRVDRIMKQFATGFTGKISPVHFFWGSFDLCCTRFSGRPAAGPPRADPVQQEAYSHEVSSAGFWPGNGGFGAAAFYSYAAPVPRGFSGRPVRPGGWNTALGEFILPYSEALRAEDTEGAILNFLETTYVAAAEAAEWDRAHFERRMASPPCE